MISFVQGLSTFALVSMLCACGGDAASSDESAATASATLSAITSCCAGAPITEPVANQRTSSGPTSPTPVPAPKPKPVANVASLLLPHSLRGFNLGGSRNPPLAEQDYADLAAYGANVARIGVNAKIKADGLSFGVADAEWTYMDAVVAMGAKYGFKVIMALQPNPWGEAEAFWESAELKESFAQIWAAIAVRYSRNPVIVGYDLANEPVMPKDRKVPSGPPIDYWTPFATQIIQAIRSRDPDSTIIFEPSPWGLSKGLNTLSPLPFDRIVYSFHFYDPHPLTHQGLYDYQEVVSYPNAVTTRASLSQDMEAARAFARKYAVPIYVGEFSIVRWAPADSAARYLTDVIELIEAEGWNWSYHAFREYEGWDPEIDPSFPRYTTASRSKTASTIRLLVEKGFSKNP